VADARRIRRDSVGPSMRKPRRASEFDFELLLQLMLELKVLTEEQRKLALTRERLHRTRITEAPARRSLGLRGADLSPIELLASFQFPDPRKRPDVLDEDRIVVEVAAFAGVPHRRIDRLGLDAALVTRTFSRAYARKHGILPLEVSANGLVVAMSNPFDEELLQNVRTLVRREVQPVLAGPSEIQRAIAEIYGFRASIQNAQVQQTGGRRNADLEQFFELAGAHDLDPAAAPIVSAVDFILNYAFDQRASDIHVEPQREESVVRMRIDGVLHTIYKIPRTLHTALTNRIKIMSRLDISSRKPQDGRIRVGRGETESRSARRGAAHHVRRQGRHPRPRPGHAAARPLGARLPRRREDDRRGMALAAERPRARHGPDGIGQDHHALLGAPCDHDERAQRAHARRSDRGRDGRHHAGRGQRQDGQPRSPRRCATFSDKTPTC